jgi:hypothetical protein
MGVDECVGKEVTARVSTFICVGVWTIHIGPNLILANSGGTFLLTKFDRKINRLLLCLWQQKISEDGICGFNFFFLITLHAHGICPRTENKRLARKQSADEKAPGRLLQLFVKRVQ